MQYPWCHIKGRLFISSSLRPPLSPGALVAQHANDLPTLMREGCAHMVRVCVNEYQLYQHFFSTVHEGLDELLDHLTRVLYDEVRPLILRRNVSGGGNCLILTPLTCGAQSVTVVRQHLKKR